MNFTEFSVGTKVSLVDPAVILELPSYCDRFKMKMKQFKEQIRPSDLIYYYCSEQAQWDAMMGSEGYALVRDGEVIDELLLKMN
jgi:hypothetical protein